MKKRSFINCYTINSSNLGISISPGINTKTFGLFPRAETVKIKESPICRFAIEENFKQSDPLFQKRWLVYNDEKETFFYRFFYSLATEATNFVYLFLTYDSIADVPQILLKNAIVIEKNMALIKLNAPTSEVYFTFKNKKFCLTPLELYVY